MGKAFKVGEHHIEFFDDYYIIVPHGDLNEEHAKKITELTVAHFADKACFTLCDLSHMGSISPAARKHFAEATTTTTSLGTALWGASFQTRLVANLIMNAINLIKRQSISSAFFKTETEARAWVDEKRRATSK